MTSLDAINAAIAQAATQPKKVSGDSGSVENHDIGDLVQAAKHVASQAAVTTPTLGLTLRQVQPPSALG